MKKKDLALILAIAITSGIFSLIAGRLIFAAPKNRQQKVEVIDAITTEFTVPESQYFNAGSINPTQLIRIAENQNSAPFNTSAE